ncbi:MAG TPA: GlsB/YeaQ/YmgE family stress response membrane protein [Devosia sp.]|jgi:uncharacterized membrane protein YeaQ/YmgE (transglycosylase-associated protein family)|nr:GlsB/YeaQ/YmgE family stress response membrane protein [Devosia sp.]
MNSHDGREAGRGVVLNDSNTRSIVVFLAIGLLAGWLASWVVGGGGLLTFLISGVLGAFVGGYLLSAFRINLPIRNVWLSQIVTATLGAIVVVLIARLIAS